MSEKRWVLKHGVVSSLPEGEYEWLDVPKANESIVPHDILRWWQGHLPENGRGWFDISNPATYLPKPRPTLREAICSVVEGGWVDLGRLINALREAGFNPDERKDN